MSDLIDRDELLILPKVLIRDAFDKVIQTCIDVADIDQLPSVEPCKDAISRQAVLNEIYNTDGISNIYFHLADKINALPPVTPQYTDAEIQKMQDLEFAEIQKAYEIGKAEKPNKWIPVSERLPEVGSEVLVCYDFKGKRSVYIADFYGDGEFHGLDEEYLTPEGKKYRKAVAWMSLPKPYEEEQDADSN